MLWVLFLVDLHRFRVDLIRQLDSLVDLHRLWVDLLTFRVFQFRVLFSVDRSMNFYEFASVNLACYFR